MYHEAQDVYQKGQLLECAHLTFEKEIIIIVKETLIILLLHNYVAYYIMLFRYKYTCIHLFFFIRDKRS